MAQAVSDLSGPRMGFEDGPLTHVLQRAMIEATGAELSLSSPLPARARLSAGPVSAETLLEALAPEELRLFTVTLSGSRIRELLEKSASRFETYAFDGRRPLLGRGEADSMIDSFEGVSYEIDLTRPPGDRVLHLTCRGVAMAPESSWTVAVDERRLARGDLGAPRAADGVWLQRALLAFVQRKGQLDERWEANWSILPDYASTPFRSSIDRLIRNRGAPREDVFRIYADQPATRGDLAYRLARAFGWREQRPSGAFPDVPESLEVWVDGLLRRDVLGPDGREEFFRPFAPLTAGVALSWCEGAARRARFVMPTSGADFRRALLSGLAPGAEASLVDTDILDHGQMLALVTNLRFPRLRLLRPEGEGGDGVREAIRRLIAEDPEGTARLDGRDTLLVLRGIRVGIESGADAIHLGSARIPLPARVGGRTAFQVCELTVDPVSLRALEMIEHRWEVDPDGRPAWVDPTPP